jgi:hypothetical protein
MTDEVTILRCALCAKSFSYVPMPTDYCPPGTKNQICTECFEQAEADARREEEMAEAYYREQEQHRD